MMSLLSPAPPSIATVNVNVDASGMIVIVSLPSPVRSVNFVVGAVKVVVSNVGTASVLRSRNSVAENCSSTTLSFAAPRTNSISAASPIFTSGSRLRYSIARATAPCVTTIPPSLPLSYR